MATPVDTLLVRIEADMAGLRRDLDRVQKQTGKTAGAFRSLGKVIAGALSVAAGIKIVNTIRQFEDLQATLVSVTGSAELAANSFQLIRVFTAQTTFQLEQTTGAFITLINAGIAPTTDVLRDVGNLAAAMGQDIRNVAQAIFNATTGEMEMLKQLGIIARVEGESLAVTYKGVTETIDRSSESIVNYIRTLSQENFPDAIEARANTLSGAISNLGDQISEFFMAIGEGGFKEALTDFTRELSSLLEAARPLARMLGMVLGAAIDTLNAVVTLLADNLKALTAAMATFLIVTNVGRIGSAAVAMGEFAKAAYQARGGMVALNSASKKNIIGILAAGLAFAAVKSGQLDEVLEKVSESFDKLTGASENAGPSIDEINASLDTINTTGSSKGVERINEELAEFQNQARIAALEAKGFESELAKVMTEAFTEFGDQGMPIVTDEENQKLTELYEAFYELRNAQDRVKRINMGVELATQGTEADELRDKIKAVGAAFVAGEVSLQQYKSSLQDLEFQLQMTKPMFETVFDALQQAGRRVSDSIAQSLMTMEFSLSSFADIAKQLIQQIISQFIQMAIVNQVLNAIFPGANLATISLGGRATGGNVNPRQPYIVGERGPEVFIPSSAGSIQNSNQTRSMSGGGGGGITINQTLQVETGVSQTVRAEMTNLLPVIKNDTINAVADARRRGGRFSSAFGA